MNYIGIKIIKAVPMTGVEFAREHPALGFKGCDHEAEGYEVTYPDGYCSWSPKDVFESAYFPMTDSDGTNVTDAMVDQFIGAIDSIKPSRNITVSSSETVTGFVQYSVSSCIDPKKFDTNIGIEENTKKIRGGIWKHLAFVVQWGLKGINQK